MKHWIAVCFCCCLISCAPFDPAPRPSMVPELPETFSDDSLHPSVAGEWWKTFGDPELDRLVDAALSGGFSVKKAWTRLRQAQALADIAGASRYPTVSGEADAGVSRRETGESSETIESYAIGIVSGYELDIWGRIRSESEAAALSAAASREDVFSAAMTVAASVAERWVDVISQRMQKRLLEKQLKTSETLLELIELRFKNAMVSALDVFQQKQVVESVRARIPQAEAKEALILHELALLTGKAPKTPIAIAREQLPILEETPATGFPADLLAQRPDIHAAGLRLYAADWETAAARANRLPSITLSAGVSLDADGFSHIWDHWLLRLAGSLAAPIWDAGKRQAEVDRVLAGADEAVLDYQEIVLTAVKEVEDTLTAETRRREHLQGLRLQMDAAQKALERAGFRYRRGLSDYLPVLTQLLSVQVLERDILDQETELVKDRIGLYRALGGRWTDTLSMPHGPS